MEELGAVRIGFDARALCTGSRADRRKTVYIDAGHGGEDSGAVGNGLFEKDINLAVSEHVTDKLKEEEPILLHPGLTIIF